jgi:hypothetical protein
LAARPLPPQQPSEGKIMRLGKIALAGAAFAATGLATAAPALAEEVPPPGTATITQVRPTVLADADGTASVLFHYTCSSPTTTGHLYVAVKQGPGISPENTSSSDAVSYSSTNWHVDQGTNALVCDGRKHVLHAVLEPDPFFPADAPTLSPGPALVQICVIDATGLSMNYSMKPVVRIGPRG